MRVVVQRVQAATAALEGRVVAGIGRGLVVLVGAGRDDDPAVARRLAAKVARLRIFERGASLFGGSVVDEGGEVLVVSQMTLAADFRRGAKPNFSRAAEGERARALYELFVATLEAEGVAVRACPFRTRLLLETTALGPFTVVLD